MRVCGRTIGVLAVAFLCHGCHSSNDDSGGAQRPLLAAFNAAGDLPDVTFLREEEVWSTIGFGVGTEYKSVGADQYDLSFDALLPGDKTATCAGDTDRDDVVDEDECTRVASVSVNVLNDHEYVVALLGRYGNLRAQVYDSAFHAFDSSDTDGDPSDKDLEVQFFHWSDELGPLDVYLEPPGTNLSAVQVRATLAAGDEFHGLVDGGSYVLTLTAVADPNAAIYTSETLALTKRTRVAFAILDGADDSTSRVKVTRFRDQGGDLLDRRTKTELRVTHVAPGTGNVDVFLQEDYTQPFVASLAFAQTSPYREVDASSLASLALDITPAGNVGVLLTREQTSLTKGQRSRFLLVTTSTGRLDGLPFAETVRRLAPYSQARLINSAAMALDFYVVPHGNNIYTSSPTATLSAGSSGGVQMLEPGSYDLVMARQGTDRFVYGPVTLELAAGGIYTIVAVATPDTTRADAVLLDDFQHR
jgi:hypothetical protein